MLKLEPEALQIPMFLSIKLPMKVLLGGRHNSWLGQAGKPWCWAVPVCWGMLWPHQPLLICVPWWWERHSRSPAGLAEPQPCFMTCLLYSIPPNTTQVGIAAALGALVGLMEGGRGGPCASS